MYRFLLLQNIIELKSFCYEFQKTITKLLSSHHHSNVFVPTKWKKVFKEYCFD